MLTVTGIATGVVAVLAAMAGIWKAARKGIDGIRTVISWGQRVEASVLTTERQTNGDLASRFDRIEAEQASQRAEQAAMRADIRAVLELVERTISPKEK